MAWVKPNEVSEDPSQGQSWAESGRATPAVDVLVDHQSVWLGQGPQVFYSSVRRCRSTQIIAMSALATVVAGLVGVMVVSLLLSGPGRTNDDHIVFHPAPAPRDVPPPHQPPATTADALITPEGTDRGSRSFDGILALASNTPQLPSSILISLNANEMSDGVLKATTLAVGPHEVKIGMYAFTLPDAHKARAVAQDIATTEARSDSGIEVTHAPSLRDVTVMRSVPGSGEPAYRAVYVLYNRVIFFEVLGKNREDADAVLNTFTSLIDQQVMTHAPPTIWPGH